MRKILISLTAAVALGGCSATKVQPENEKFVWEGANMYFLLVDRFQNGDKTNDVTLGRTKQTGKLRGFEGGDIRGIIQKLDEGYFSNLGINAIWFTPVVEQIHDATNEGTGNTYGFHGYWATDWSALDPNFGTEKDLAELIDKAHRKGIRIVLDGVINHTGPVTPLDAAWPNEWVRTSPQCKYDNYENTTACTLVRNLPDVITETDTPVELPPLLVAKWKKEGRYDKEVKELDAFFARTGYPRAPKYYIIKWLTDYVRDYGIDGYRADTVKHLGEEVWAAFSTECNLAFKEWKANNPEKVLGSHDFFTVGEVYGYSISSKRLYDFGDKKVDYYSNGFTALINFEMKYDATKSYEETFAKYSGILNNELKGKTVLNYLASHDDGEPFDKNRSKTIEAGTKLLLTPGISQVYYGDELARPLQVPGVEGDANLRSFMNWNDLDKKPEARKVYEHYRKLGLFRKAHPSVGAGVHKMITASPYVFQRVYDKGVKDKVVIGLDLPSGQKTISAGGVFSEGTIVKDAYSGTKVIVKNNSITINTPFTLLLIEELN